MKMRIPAISALVLSLALAGQPALALSEDEQAVAGALVILGVASLLHDEHHYREGYKPTSEVEIADFERGYRDGLHNYGYDTRFATRAYSEGYSSGQHERDARHSHHDNRAEEHRASVPRPAANACVGQASTEWRVPSQHVHIVKARKEAAKDLFVELTAGRHNGVCEVSPDGEIYLFRKGRL